MYVNSIIWKNFFIAGSRKYVQLPVLVNIHNSNVCSTTYRMGQKYVEYLLFKNKKIVYHTKEGLKRMCTVQSVSIVWSDLWWSLQSFRLYQPSYYTYWEVLKTLFCGKELIRNPKAIFIQLPEQFSVFVESIHSIMLSHSFSKSVDHKKYWLLLARC